MNKIIASNPPMLARAGRVNKKVLNTNLKELPLRINLNILKTLITLSTRKTVPMLLNNFRISIIIPIKVKIRTTKSNMLKLSRKKIFPSAIIFKIYSTKKSPIKARFP